MHSSFLLATLWTRMKTRIRSWKMGGLEVRWTRPSNLSEAPSNWIALVTQYEWQVALEYPFSILFLGSVSHLWNHIFVSLKFTFLVIFQKNNIVWSIPTLILTGILPEIALFWNTCYFTCKVKNQKRKTFCSNLTKNPSSALIFFSDAVFEALVY